MTGRVLPFESHAHRDVERLLPWYANGTLDAVEASRVHAHVSGCAACRDALVELRALLDAPVSADDPRDTQQAWLRMRDRLHAVRHAPPARIGWRNARNGWRRAPAWARVALVAQCAMIAVLVALAMRPPSSATFETLSTTPAPHVGRDTLLVVFDPRITDAQLRDLLGAHHARIVDGPNATGAFLVVAPQGQAVTVRDALRASPGVAMAERLAPPE